MRKWKISILGATILTTFYSAGSVARAGDRFKTLNNFVDKGNGSDGGMTCSGRLVHNDDEWMNASLSTLVPAVIDCCSTGVNLEPGSPLYSYGTAYPAPKSNYAPVAPLEACVPSLWRIQALSPQPVPPNLRGLAAFLVTQDESLGTYESAIAYAVQRLAQVWDGSTLIAPFVLGWFPVHWYGATQTDETISGELAGGGVILPAYTEIPNSDTDIRPMTNCTQDVRVGDRWKFTCTPVVGGPTPYNCMAWGYFLQDTWGMPSAYGAPPPRDGQTWQAGLRDIGYDPTTAVACDDNTCAMSRPKILMAWSDVARKQDRDWVHTFRQQEATLVADNVLGRNPTLPITANGKWTSKNGQTSRYYDIRYDRMVGPVGARIREIDFFLRDSYSLLLTDATCYCP